MLFSCYINSLGVVCLVIIMGKDGKKVLVIVVLGDNIYSISYIFNYL